MFEIVMRCPDGKIWSAKIHPDMKSCFEATEEFLLLIAAYTPEARELLNTPAPPVDKNAN